MIENDGKRKSRDILPSKRLEDDDDDDDDHYSVCVCVCALWKLLLDFN